MKKAIGYPGKNFSPIIASDMSHAILHPHCVDVD